MLVGRERFDEVYATIRQSACGAGQTVLILVAPDTDAICACQILCRLLRDDNVPFCTKPVSGYADVRAATEDVAQQFSDIKTIVMLNCGATVNLEKLFDQSQATIFVVDSHRPVHLRNYHSPGRVVILDGDAPDDDDAPSDGEDLDEDFMESDLESDAELSSSDDEPEGDEETEKQKRRRERREARQAKKAEASDRRKRLRAYYDGTYDGPPSAALLFALTEACSTAEPTEVWLSALGTTGARAQWRLDDDAYDDFTDYFAAQLRHIDARKQTSGEPMPESGKGYQAPPGTVTYERDELRFMLHRHWSLFDAMYYSNYVAARLSVWKHDGKRRLQELLAKIGLSLEACRQTYAFLSLDERTSLRDNLKVQGPAYDLDDPFTATFHRVAGGGRNVSAHDVAACVEALLEGHFTEDASHALVRAAKKRRGEVVDTEDEASVEKRAFLRGFWHAYDACLGDDDALLSRGVHAACALQRGVVGQAVSMVEKREITTLRHFRYAYVQASNDVFSKPLALRKLALFLVGVHTTNGKWVDAKAKPLVLLAERRDCFLVAGVDGREGARKNRLAHAFRLAAEHIQTSSRQDLFDSSVVEVAHDDVQRFVESLHYIMAQSAA